MMQVMHALQMMYVMQMVDGKVCVGDGDGVGDDGDDDDDGDDNDYVKKMVQKMQAMWVMQRMQ